MGVKHSKPRLKRRLSYRSSQKRQSPEGGPAPSSTVTKDASPLRGCGKECPCNKLSYSCTEEQSPPKLNYKSSPKILPVPSERHNLDGDVSLRVNLPPESMKSPPLGPSDPTERSDKASEWTITLDDEIGDQSHCDDVTRLLTSIREAVDSGIEGSRGRAKIKVRLSVTPDPRSRDALRNSDVTPSLLRRHRAKEIERIAGENEREGEVIRPSTSANFLSFDRQENMDRRRHYRQIPGIEHDGQTGKHTKPEVQHNPSNGPCEKTLDHRKDKSKSRSRSRDRPCPGAGCCRRHIRCTSRDKPRNNANQSRYDFHEAMYLRLTELQRESSLQAKLARFAGDSGSDVSDSDGSDSEYSGDDDNCVVGGKPETRGSRMFEPLTSQAVRAISRNHETKQEERTEQNVEGNATTTVEHHYHGMHNPACCSDSNVENEGRQQLIKPWHKPDTPLQTGKRKTLKKKRSSGSSKTNHGYLRANALAPGAIGTFPNTPKVSQQTSNVAKSPVMVQRHQHEHYHHHYYYHCKPDAT